MKPPLLLRELDEGRIFTPLEFPVTAELVNQFCKAVGDENPLYLSDDAARAAGYPSAVAPPSLANIFGRQAYLRDYSMPPGGLLAGQSITYHGPGFVGDIYTVKAQVTSRSERKGRPVVVIQSTAYRPNGDPVATVQVTAVWPLDAA